MNSIRLSLLIMLLSCGTGLHAQETSIDLRKDGRIITAKRLTFFRGCLSGPNAQTKLCKYFLGLSQDPRDKLAGMDLIGLVVPDGKTGDRYLIGLVIGSSTLPQDFSVSENDFRILRDYATKKALSKIDEKHREIQQAGGDDAKVKNETNELRLIVEGSGKESELNSLYAGFLLASEVKTSEKAPYADLVTKYRQETEKSLEPFISLLIKQNKLPSVTPFMVGASDDSFNLSDLQGYPVDVESPGYLKVWRGRTLVVVVEKSGAPFNPSRYKGGLVEYLTSENSTLTASFSVPIAALPFDPSRAPEVASAIAALHAQVDRNPELFSAPSSRLQTELINNNQSKEAAKEIIATLFEYKQQLPEIALERAALLAFALEDYRRAAEFVDTGLKTYVDSKQLLAARGLIQYQQSLYPQALTSLRQATPSDPVANRNFGAAVLGNQSLVHWGLGQTSDAESLLYDSVALFRGNETKQQQTYLLLTQADFYADYGHWTKALKMGDDALKLVGTAGSDKHGRIVAGRVHRLRAKVALVRGSINEATQEIGKAIRIHQSEANFLELAKDKDIQADIEEQTGMHLEALKTLEEAAIIYKDNSFIKGQSENLWKRANVLLSLNKFAEAERFVNDASDGFAQLNYRRGLGECEALRGVLILRRANHQYLMRFNQEITRDEKQAADEEFLSQVRPAVEHFETAIKIFQEIGYKRGVAYAKDKLAINLIVLQEKPLSQVFEMAAQNSNEAARIYEEIDDKRGKAVAFGNLGIIYRRYGNFELAIKNLEKSLQLCNEINFKLGIGRQLFNLGRVYYAMAFSENNSQGLAKQQLLQARKYFLQAQGVFGETQGGQDELNLVEKFLNNISEILPNL